MVCKAEYFIQQSFVYFLYFAQVLENIYKKDMNWHQYTIAVHVNFDNSI